MLSRSCCAEEAWVWIVSVPFQMMKRRAWCLLQHQGIRSDSIREGGMRIEKRPLSAAQCANSELFTIAEREQWCALSLRACFSHARLRARKMLLSAEERRAVDLTFARFRVCRNCS